MIGMRKLVGFLMALAFALSAGAAFGGDKQYTLVMSPATGTSPIATMTAKFTNQGNSSFNSLTLKVPANYTVSGTITASRGNVTYSGGTITVQSINLPTGSGQFVTVTMNGVTTGGGSCGSGVAGNWTAVVWTGSRSAAARSAKSVRPRRRRTFLRLASQSRRPRAATEPSTRIRRKRLARVAPRYSR